MELWCDVRDAVDSVGQSEYVVIWITQVWRVGQDFSNGQPRRLNCNCERIVVVVSIFVVIILFVVFVDGGFATFSGFAALNYAKLKFILVLCCLCFFFDDTSSPFVIFTVVAFNDLLNHVVENVVVVD